jgi:hypothetical protein
MISVINENCNYDDMAIVLAWPDTTARADEAWYRWFKKVGILKNLNFKVGHAAIILIDSQSGKLRYFDFGRYVTPRGYGRARSEKSDPKLTLKSRAIIKRTYVNSDISNIAEIINELEHKKQDTHGNGELFYSIVQKFSFKKGTSFADKMVTGGSTIYSAFAPGNNNCSRFIQQVLAAGVPKDSLVWNNVMHPETFVASPVSNVVNATENHLVYRTLNGITRAEFMNRKQSRRHFIHQVSVNFNKRQSAELPSDRFLGFLNELERLKSIPVSAQWLGGIGEGGWYCLEYDQSNVTIGFEIQVEITKYDVFGSKEFRNIMYHAQNTQLNPQQPYKFIYDAHATEVNIVQNNFHYRFTPVYQNTTQESSKMNRNKSNMQLIPIINEPQYS